MFKLNYKSLFFILIIALLLNACGSKKSPTGGPVDTINPSILNVSPNNFEQIMDNQIQITFSKPIDQNSIKTGLQFYPPVTIKKLSWNNNTLTIKIKDELKANTNYFLNLSNQIKCSHGNSLENPVSYIFKNGTLNNHLVTASFLYDDDKDKSLEKKILLLDNDSLLVIQKKTFDNSVIFENLNKQDHVIRAYIDKNNNNKYDHLTEPYVQADAKLTEKSPILLKLAYADTTKPDVKQIKALSRNDIEIVFSENLLRIPHVVFINDDKKNSLNILASALDNNIMHYITDDQDTIKYRVVLNQITDKKLNINDKEIYMNGSSKLLKNKLKIVSITPRNGTAVSELKPIFKIDFSEIILNENLAYSLIEQETKNKIKMKILKGNSKSFELTPDQPLKKFNSYIFKVEKSTHNHHDNLLDNDYEILFLITEKKNK